MLMLGVIALANAKLQLQFVWAGAYISINIAHWVVAAVPQKMHWELSCYEIREQGIDDGPRNCTFTEALWKAILFTKSIDWVKKGEAAPSTKAWDQWLDEAEEQANRYGSHIGPLQDARWTEGDLSKATIFNAPKKDDWDPRDAWGRIQSEHKKSDQVWTTCSGGAATGSSASSADSG
jgi:hypothetical protein